MKEKYLSLLDSLYNVIPPRVRMMIIDVEIQEKEGVSYVDTINNHYIIKIHIPSLKNLEVLPYPATLYEKIAFVFLHECGHIARRLAGKDIDEEGEEIEEWRDGVMTEIWALKKFIKWREKWERKK